MELSHRPGLDHGQPSKLKIFAAVSPRDVMSAVKPDWVCGLCGDQTKIKVHNRHRRNHVALKASVVDILASVEESMTRLTLSVKTGLGFTPSAMKSMYSSSLYCTDESSTSSVHIITQIRWRAETGVMPGDSFDSRLCLNASRAMRAWRGTVPKEPLPTVHCPEEPH